MKRAALIVGIDRYDDPGIRSLQYAERDATELYGFLKHRARYAEVRLLQRAGEDEVLNCAAEIVRALAPGDLFLFSFAGHGLTHAGRHLLLGPRARLKRLQYFQGTVPLDLLKDETVSPGVQRVFVLDACRSDLEPGREAAGPGLRGEQLLRDVVGGPALAGSAPLALICSCGEGCKALEAPHLGQGLFSRALLDEMAEALETEAELSCGEALQQRLRERMGRLAKECGLSGEQRPWIQLSDQAPVLIPRRQDPTLASAHERPASAVRVKCPICGRRNVEADTFECKHCGRDYLCTEHFVESGRCCEECAQELAREREEAERRAMAEVEIRAREHAAREAEERRQQIEQQRQEGERRRREEQRQRAEAEQQAREEAERKAQEEVARRQHEAQVAAKASPPPLLAPKPPPLPSKPPLTRPAEPAPPVLSRPQRPEAAATASPAAVPVGLNPRVASLPAAEVQTACLTVSRRSAWFDFTGEFSILADGQVIERVGAGAQASLTLPPGEHTLEVGHLWSRSRPLEVKLGPGEEVLLECRYEARWALLVFLVALAVFFPGLRHIPWVLPLVFVACAFGRLCLCVVPPGQSEAGQAGK